MAEDRRADRPRQEADEINEKSVERADQRIVVREIELGENQARDGAVEEEILPLDRRADGRGDDGAAQFARMIDARKRADGLCCRHDVSPTAIGFVRAAYPGAISPKSTSAAPKGASRPPREVRPCHDAGIVQ